MAVAVPNGEVVDMSGEIMGIIKENRSYWLLLLRKAKKQNKRSTPPALASSKNGSKELNNTQNHTKQEYASSIIR